MHDLDWKIGTILHLDTTILAEPWILIQLSLLHKISNQCIIGVEFD